MTQEPKVKFNGGDPAAVGAKQPPPIQSEWHSPEVHLGPAAPATPRKIGGVSASWDGPKADGAKTRLLFLGLCPPVPATNGQRMRNHNLLRALKKEGIDVFFLAFAEPEDLQAPHDELFVLCEGVELVPAPMRNGRLREYLGRFANLFMLSPYGPQRFRSKRMTSALGNLLSGKCFQAIICDDVYLAANLPKDLSIPVLLNKHDLTYEIVGRYVETERNFLKKLYGTVQYRKIRRMEIRECKRARAVLACSARDKELIQLDCPAANVFILPNVVDTDDYSIVSSEEDNLILFVGALDWLPNRDAVDYFVARIFPRLREMHPGVRFGVAGRLPPPWFAKRLADISGLELHANVQDIRPIIARAAVCVVPLRIGSGTRLKILEAAAMAKPIVSTRLGAEGLEFRDGQEIVLEDEPAAFADAVVKLLSAAPDRRRLGQAARKMAEQNYSLLALRASLREALNTLTRDAILAQSASVRETLGGS